MLWLIPAVVACLAAALAFWTRGLHAPGALFAVAGFALVFLLGRTIEAGRDRAWEQAAARLHGTFRSEPPCGDLDRFGTPAPWQAWSSDGELRCRRVIQGDLDGVPYAVVQVRYSVRERRGEERPDAWYEVTVAVLRAEGGPPAGALLPVRAPEGYVAMRNAQSLFLWKKGSPGAGASLRPAQLPSLLDQARALRSAAPVH